MTETANPSRELAAAEALTALLPTPAALAAVLLSEPAVVGEPAREAVVASFVGEVSAEVALVLLDSAAVALPDSADTPQLSLSDVLRPALEAATAQLGTGLLGEATRGDASSLFAEPETTVFELRAGAETVGWFALRLRREAGATPAARSVIGRLGRISGVEMTMTVEIGRTRMAVRDVLALEPGAVVELDRSAGAPADILLNGRLIAHGEVVVVDQDYAVRITKILDAAEGLA